MAAAQAELQFVRLEAVRDEAEATSGQHWLGAWEGMYQRSGGRRTLVATPPVETMFERFERVRSQAAIAGRVFYTALQLAADPRTRDQASINLAKDIVHRDLPDKLPTVRPLPRSHKPVDEAWSNHRCVAPLAAAAVVTRDTLFAGGQERGNQFPADVTATEMIQLVRAEAALKQLGAETVPRRRSKSILPPDDLLPLRFGVNRPDKDAVTFRPLADDILAAVRNRQKRPKNSGLRGG